MREDKTAPLADEKAQWAIMPVQSLLEHLGAVTERIRRAEATVQGAYARVLVPPFSETHVFLLGEADRVKESMREVWEDLNSELKSRVPLPFKDVTLVVRVESSGPDIQDDYWEVTRIIEASDFAGRKPTEMGPGTEAFIVIDYAASDSRHADFPGVQILWFEGHGDGTSGVALSQRLVIQDGTVVTEAPGHHVQPLQWARFNMIMVAAISHPANYVVQVTPSLTPREERRVAAGKGPPAAKAPHFIIVDHEILVRMSGRPTGAHASPIPHERRGHWRRLAERCRHARLRGSDRTWVGPSYVGERTFSDGKNAYEVLLDFRSRTAAHDHQSKQR